MLGQSFLVKFLMSVPVGFIAATAVVTGLLLSHQTFAVSTPNTLKVSPARTDIEIQPGASKTVKTTITNLTKDSITVRAIGNDFVSGDERGTPAIILDENSYAPTRSLKRFMAPLSDVTIPARQAKVVDVLITVPKEAQAGGYFGAVRFAPISPDNGGQVNLSASVASIILLTVSGDIVEKLELTDFDIQQDGKSGTTFDTPDDLQASVRFRNKGNVQVGPFGKVSLKSADKVIYETDFNNKDPRDMILPDSARRWDIPLKQIDAFGQYTVNATFTYGKKNQTVELTKSFWIIPHKMIAAIIVGFLVLLLLGGSLWLFFRRVKHRKKTLRIHGNSRSRSFRRR